MITMNINPEKFGYIRKSKNISQKEMAKHIGLREQNISLWECGTKAVPVKYHQKICDILGVSFEELCSEYRGGGYVLTSPQPSITITVK